MALHVKDVLHFGVIAAFTAAAGVLLSSALTDGLLQRIPARTHPQLGLHLSHVCCCFLAILQMLTTMMMKTSRCGRTSAA
jgi:hypothetical protein